VRWFPFDHCSCSPKNKEKEIKVWREREMTTTFIEDPPQSLLPRNYTQWCDETYPPERVIVVNTEKSSALDTTVCGSLPLPPPDSVTKEKEKEERTIEISSRKKEFSRATVKDLRELCKTHHLKTTGNRDELEKRLAHIINKEE
jgi:hypothetical protein